MDTPVYTHPQSDDQYLGTHAEGMRVYDLYVHLGSRRFMDYYRARYGNGPNDVVEGRAAHGGLFYPALVVAHKQHQLILQK
jgi:hypothetical protein